MSFVPCKFSVQPCASKFNTAETTTKPPSHISEGIRKLRNAINQPPNAIRLIIKLTTFVTKRNWSFWYQNAVTMHCKVSLHKLVVVELQLKHVGIFS